MTYVSDFFAGAFICKGLPHLPSGLHGIPFPSPFAKPPGVGDSPPIVNVLWASFNLMAGLLLLSRHPVLVGFHRDFAVLSAVFVLMGGERRTRLARCGRRGLQNDSRGGRFRGLLWDP